MTTQTLEILTPQSPRWNEFADALYETLTAGLPKDQWRCDGDGYNNDPKLVHRYAKQVMQDMRCVDIDGSLAYFKDHGGYCDCEILWNVDRGS
jgi:Protein of unknown function (DUF2695)